MTETHDYTGKKIIVYDETTQKTIAETTILEYDRGKRLLTVDSRELTCECEYVSVLIFGDNGLYEYKGSVRKSPVYGHISIALYKGKPKEDRAHTRYTVHAKASISQLVIGNRLVPIRTPVEMAVVNLSVNGILLRGYSNLMNVGTSFQLRLHLGGDNPALLNTTVVRIKKPASPDTDYEYGCRLNFQYD